MAAYAALVSLMNIVEQIENHPRPPISLDKKQTESFREKVSFLEQFIEKYSHESSTEVEAMESQIASAAYAAEDVIETHIVDQIQAGSVSFLDLRKVIEEMDSVEERVKNLQEEMGFHDLMRPPTSSAPLTTTDRKSKMVGCHEELIHLMDVLTGQQSSRQVIPIVGMGGIGKTTLARSVYENPLIVQCFDILLWVTVSQEYNLRKILLELLSCQRKPNSGLDERSDYELGEQLYKSLCGWRCLIVLDDMWSVEAWNEIELFVPDNNNGSRIVVTTRQSNLATHFGSTCLVKEFLDEDTSWNLFCEKAFGEEGCPLELESIGKKIVSKCKGLPLSVVVIGELLGKSTRTRKHWDNISKDINSILNSGEDDQCVKILSLSYPYLPAHLKPCFLYMGIFPEDKNIKVSYIVKLWVAEGFLKPNKSQSFEEVAEGYLKDLIDRNLVLVSGFGSRGNIKTCHMHDLLRDVCIRIAKKEKFLCVMSSLDTSRCLNMDRCIVYYERTHKDDRAPGLLSALLARSVITYHCWESLSQLRLLRVFGDDRSAKTINYDPTAASFQQVNLRYLSHECYWRCTLPSSISLLWNVQTLIFRSVILPAVAPQAIWEMSQLRHLVFGDIYLPDPPPSLSDQHDDLLVLQNLQTLEKVSNFRLSDEVCKRIPNLKKLKVSYTGSFSDYCIYNLERFHKLEFLCLAVREQYRDDILQNLKLPSSLKKLSLDKCDLHWEDLTMIGSLPHLEVLRLASWSFVGPEWNPVEGEFLHLKVLKIYGGDLMYWNANSSHFPVLKHLFIYNMYTLDEVPLGIGEIPTLQAIDLDRCSISAAISVTKILTEQESIGNEGLQVKVTFWSEGEFERFRKKVEHELEGFTSNNLQVDTK